MTAETKLDELKRVCEPINSESMRTVTRLELLALVECAEVLRECHLADLDAIKRLPSTYPNGMDDVALVKRSHEALIKLEAL